MLDVVLEGFFKKRYAVPLISFNPCCAGCSSGRIADLIWGIIAASFNPCCAGCSSGSCIVSGSIFVAFMFQSLLCWM